MLIIHHSLSASTLTFGTQASAFPTSYSEPDLGSNSFSDPESKSDSDSNSNSDTDTDTESESDGQSGPTGQNTKETEQQGRIKRLAQIECKRTRKVTNGSFAGMRARFVAWNAFPEGEKENVRLCVAAFREAYERMIKSGLSLKGVSRRPDFDVSVLVSLSKVISSMP